MRGSRDEGTADDGENSTVDLTALAAEAVMMVEPAAEERNVTLELETVRVSIANLRTFPCIPEREAAGTLRIHGAYFALRDGVLHVMDDDGAFAPA